MADQNYKLLIALLLNDQLSGGLKKTLAHLRAFGSESKKALRDYNQFRSGVAKPLPTSAVDKYSARMKAAVKETRAFGTEQGKLNRRFSQPINTKGLDAQIGKLRQYRRELRATGKESDGLRTSMRGGMPGGRGLSTGSGTRRRSSQRGGFLNSMERADDFLQGTRQIAGAWRERADSLRPYVDEATRLLRAQERLKIIGLPEGDNARAFAAVRQQVQGMKGLTLADTTENVLDLVGALGNVDQAIKALPLASKYKLGFETLFGDTFSSGQINEQVRASFKFLELTGNTMKGAQRMEDMLNVVTKISASTGGRVNPMEMLLMARRGNPAIQSLTPEGLRNISTLIEDMGAEQTGTALMSTYTALVGGVMKESAIAEFDRLGLLNKGKFKVNKRTGRASKMLPGGNILGPMFQDDPLKAADMLMSAMQAKGINTSDDKAVQAELQILFQNRNAFRMMNMLTTQRGQIAKESQRAGQSKGVSEIYDQLKDSPLMKFKQYEAAMTDFRASLGQGILPMMSKFAQTAEPIARFFSTHPDVAEFAAKLFLVGKAGGGLVQTFATLKQTQALNMLVRARSDGFGAAEGLSAAERNALGLNKRLGNLSANPFVITLKFLTIGFAIEKLFSMMDEVDQKKKQFEENIKASGAAYDEFVASRRAFTPRSTIDERNKLVSQALEHFNLGGFRTLEQALAPEKRGYGGYAWTGQRTYASRWSTGIPQYFGLPSAGEDFRPDIAAQIFKQAKPLQDPFVLSRLLVQARRGEIDYIKPPQTEIIAKQAGLIKSTRLEKFEQALQLAFPQSFGQASKLAEEEMKGVRASSEQLGKQLNDLLNPAGRLPDVFGRVASAADNLAFRLGGVQPTYVQPLENIFGNNPPKPFGGFPTPKPIGQPFTLPSKASGGTVERGGFVKVHALEQIVPARVTRAWDSGALQDAVRSFSSNSSENHYHINLNVSGGVKDPDRLSTDIAEKLAAKISEIERTVNDRRHFDRMYSKASRNERQRS